MGEYGNAPVISRIDDSGVFEWTIEVPVAQPWRLLQMTIGKDGASVVVIADGDESLLRVYSPEGVERWQSDAPVQGRFTNLFFGGDARFLAAGWVEDSTGRSGAALWRFQDAPPVSFDVESGGAPGLGVAPNPVRPGEPVVLTGGAQGLSVYDVTGRLVRQWRGAAEVVWDGSDAGGSGLPAGVYFVRSENGGEAHSRKLIRLR